VRRIIVPVRARGGRRTSPVESERASIASTFGRDFLS
jgi:hypothetical protein